MPILEPGRRRRRQRPSATSVLWLLALGFAVAIAVRPSCVRKVNRAREFCRSVAAVEFAPRPQVKGCASGAGRDQKTAGRQFAFVVDGNHSQYGGDGSSFFDTMAR